MLSLRPYLFFFPLGGWFPPSSLLDNKSQLFPDSCKEKKNPGSSKSFEKHRSQHSRHRHVELYTFARSVWFICILEFAVYGWNMEFLGLCEILRWYHRHESGHESILRCRVEIGRHFCVSQFTRWPCSQSGNEAAASAVSLQGKVFPPWPLSDIQSS